MHGAHAARLEPALEAEVEVGRVDADEDVGLPVQDPAAQAAAQAQQAGQVGQHFGQSHDRKLAGVMPGVHSGGAHRVAADAREFRVGEAFAQAFDEVGAQQVTGGLAGDQREARPCRHHRNSGRSPPSMKSSIRRTSSLSVARSASFVRASSRVSPDMYTVR